MYWEDEGALQNLDLQEDVAPQELNFNDTGVISNIPDAQMYLYKSFIERSMSKYKIDFRAENQISMREITETRAAPHNHIYRVKNYAARLEQLEARVQGMTDGQKSGYNKAVSHINGTNPTQLIMFLTGEGGTGKSRVISDLMEYCKLHFGKQRGVHGAAIALAPTGSAANNIDGYTWQSVLGRGKKSGRKGSQISEETARRVGKLIEGVKLIIINEISLLSLEELAEIHERLKSALLTTTEDELERATIQNSPFGGVHILLTGDFYQLKNFTGTPLYRSKPDPKYAAAVTGRKLWLYTNEFCELTENCRFRNALLSAFATFMRSSRLGNVDNDLLRIMNQRLVTGVVQAQAKSHPKAVWIANTRERVKELNILQFQHLRSQGNFGVRIVAQHTPGLQGTTFPGHDARQQLYNLADTDCVTYMDLAIGSRVICTQNIATQIGLFNGATGTVVGFGFKNLPPAVLFPESSRFHMHVDREIPIVFVKMDKYRGSSLTDQHENVVPFAKVVSDHLYLQKYHRWQLPLAAAAAITTHKSQSMTAHFGAVIEPPLTKRSFARSLAYVQCSRVPDIELLLLLNPLLPEHFTSHSADRLLILEEYTRLRKKFLDQID